MGEMAEDAYDRALMELEDLEGDPDYYGHGAGFGVQSLFGYGAPPPRRFEQCPHCGAAGLERSGRGAESYLYKSGSGRHICHSRIINDFDDLDDLSDLI